MTIFRTKEYPIIDKFETLQDAEDYCRKLRTALQQESSERVEDFDILQLSNIPWIDVRGYGAKAGGVGGTDDSSAIQAALDAATNGEMILLEAGKTYPITTGLTMAIENQCLCCFGGEAIISTATDIDALTISKRAYLKNIRFNHTGTSTKAGVKLVDGAKLCCLESVKSLGFKYAFELSSSTSTGVAYNEFYTTHAAAETICIYIHDTGSGWANENLFSGGNCNAGTSAISVYTEGNQNKFMGVAFEGNDVNDFSIKDYGDTGNIFIGCRFEGGGYGAYFENTSNFFGNSSRIVENYFSCKFPIIAIKAGRVRVVDENFIGGITVATGANENRVATTVDGDSASGQKVLAVASTTGMYTGDVILINEDGAREEWCHIDTISAGVSVTTITNLRYTHTAVQADTVRIKGRKYGMDFYGAWDSVDVYTYGKKVSTFKWSDTEGTILEADALRLGDCSGAEDILETTRVTDYNQNIRVGEWNALGTLHTSAGLVLGNNARVDTAANNQMLISKTNAYGARALLIKALSGFEFHADSTAVTKGDAFSSLIAKLDQTGIFNVAGSYEVDDTQVVTNQQTGISAMTNVTTPVNWDADTVTTAELADIVGTLISKLRTHGLVTT